MDDSVVVSCDLEIRQSHASQAHFNAKSFIEEANTEVMICSVPKKKSKQNDVEKQNIEDELEQLRKTLEMIK